MKTDTRIPLDLKTLIKNFPRPKKAVVTAGMPYANGPLHLGHLAGAHIPADIHSRWLRMLVGNDNVLFVCGTDDHGSASELAAIQAGLTVRGFIDRIQQQQDKTLKNYSIGLDIYSGTSQPDCFPIQKELAQNFMRTLHKKGMLEKRTTRQWFDPKMGRFLQDRYVRGKCPNPKCENLDAYCDECDVCGANYDPTELINPRSALSDAVPLLKDSVHWWLDMTSVSESLRVWIQSKKSSWRMPVYNEVISTVMPALMFDNLHEEKYKELKGSLPAHKSKYAPGKKIMAQFENKADLEAGAKFLRENGIENTIMDRWAYRSFTRDVSWGVPVPEGLEPELAGKTLYVWPDSLIAPIAFSTLAIKKKGWPAEKINEFWKDPEAQIFQFLGQDNVFFYVIMQGAMWFGMQADSQRLPIKGELQQTEILGCYHLLVNGEKMSKSKGNFYSADQLIGEMGYSPEQIRYFLATLNLSEKASNFDFKHFEERNKFLAGPLNAALEKPISAVHSKYNGEVPVGELIEKVVGETEKLVQKYLRSMNRSEYVTILNLIENYARQINSLFTQFKPHDDRFPELERKNALFTSFYVLKNLMIMLYPFVPATMDKLRVSLNLPPEVFRVEELGTSISCGHKIGAQLEYFPSVKGEEGHLEA